MTDPQETSSGDRLRVLAQRYVETYAWADADAIELHFRLNSAVEAMKGASGRLVRGLGPSLGPTRGPGRFGVLRALYFAPEQRLSQTEIGEHMHLTAPNVSYLIDGLEKEGIVARVPHPSNRRITWVQLTETGEKVCQAMVPAMTAHMGALANGFTDDEMRLFNEFLRRFKDNAEASQRDD